MENFAAALRHISEAINLDSNGFQKEAFSKYLGSLQILILCLNNIASLEFEKLLSDNKKPLQILHMICECSDRMTSILKNIGKLSYHSSSDSLDEEIPEVSAIRSSLIKFPPFEKIQNENLKLFRQYKMRLDRAKDKYSQTNLHLEYQRRLMENEILARKKYELAFQQIEKNQRFSRKEQSRKSPNIFSEELDEKDKEKQELYRKVIDFLKKEAQISPQKQNSYEVFASEAAEKVFNGIIRCYEHPLTQYLIFVTENIKKNIDTVLKTFCKYLPYLPGNISEEVTYDIKEYNCNYSLTSSKCNSIQLTSSQVETLENKIEALSSEIKDAFENSLEIFYVSYKPALPEDSEIYCYYLIEKYFMQSLWPKFLLLLRIWKLASEYKFIRGIHAYQSFDETALASGNILHDVNSILKNISLQHSLTEKLKILVKVIEIICDKDSSKDNKREKLGVDEMMPLLCNAIVEFGFPQLLSECHALDQLCDIKYMLGKEGFALSSFLTAMKVIEEKQMSD